MEYKLTFEVHGSIPCSPKEEGLGMLYGEIIDPEPGKEDIRTSVIKQMVFVDNYWYAITLNSTYRLVFKSPEVLRFIQKHHPKVFK